MGCRKSHRNKLAASQRKAVAKRLHDASNPSDAAIRILSGAIYELRALDQDGIVTTLIDQLQSIKSDIAKTKGDS